MMIFKMLNMEPGYCSGLKITLKIFFVRKGIKITYQTSQHEKELSVISSVNKRADLALILTNFSL